MLDKWTGAAILAAMTIAAPPADAAPALRFACSVKGAELVRPALGVPAICAQVKAGVDRALGTTSRTVSAAPDATRDKDGWIRVDIRIAKPGIASATVTRASGGRVVTHPELSVAQSDRPIDAATIDLLVRGMVAKLG